MKVKMIRCGICDTWLHVSRNHCHICGASRSIKVGNRVMHFNYSAMQNGHFVQMVRGTWSHLTLKNLLAREESA